MRLRKLILIGISMKLIIPAEGVHAQNLGHKMPGLIGLDAGRIPEPGLYLVDHVVTYTADEVRDRNGNAINIPNLQLSALSNAAGVSYTMKLAGRPLFLTLTGALPVARFRLNVPDRPEASFDRFGLTDIYIQPARLGWRQERFDAVASYSLYLPTGDFPQAGSEGLSSGQVTHEFSAGGILYGRSDRTSFVTALASYDLNRRKRNVDITRGDTFQIQGGAGVSRFNRMLEVGLAAHALWQVRDDRGADVPATLRGARDRVLGLGPEGAVAIRPIRSQIRIRYVWDIGVRSRPVGAVFVVGLNFVIRHAAPPA
jgi:hypothetical protein